MNNKPKIKSRRTRLFGWRKEKVPDSAPRFGFKGLVRKARVSRVIDGDTIDVIFKFRKKYDMHRCRLLGINAPEIRGGTFETKEMGKKSKQFLEDLLLGEIVVIYCDKLDSFGRILVAVEFEGEDVAEKLLYEGLAEPH